MGKLADLLMTRGLAQALPAPEAEALAAKLSSALKLEIYPRSLCGSNGAVYGLGRRGIEKSLVILRAAGNSGGNNCPFHVDGDGFEASVFPADAPRAAAVRQALPFASPTTLGTKTSVGLGDRLGLAGPGHIRAIRGTGVATILAQQSIRELTRTERTPQEVMDAATWAVLQEGWRDGFGSDADHLKTAADVDLMAEAGFTLFTVDPGEHVDNAAETDSIEALRRKVEALPWDALASTAEDCRRAFAGAKPSLDGGERLAISEEAALRAAAKYGRAVAHTAAMARHLERVAGARKVEVEMSVDETDTPTSPEAHYYVAAELKRLNVLPVSLAPRFVGRFEKGVDYIGDLGEFERTFAAHAAIARTLGPYKISLHSGSDKFKVYAIAARLARGLVHVKTAGTSYLEALRAIASSDPALFREILSFAHERYERDKASYHVSADLRKVPETAALADRDLATVLDLFDGRQMLHVTFGSVLTIREAGGKYRFRDRLLLALRKDEEGHYRAIEKHLGRHVEPLRK